MGADGTVRASRRPLTVTYSSADLPGAVCVISIFGWNVPKVDVSAPAP